MGSSYYREQDYAIAIPAIKKIQHNCVCEKHKLRTRLKHDFDSEGVNVYIVKCCCQELADCVALALNETCLVNKVYLETETGITKTKLICQLNTPTPKWTV